MNTETEIAAFQAALLEILANAEAGVTQRLLDHPDCAIFTDYIQTFEEPMVQVAASLVKQWGKKQWGKKQ